MSDPNTSAEAQGAGTKTLAELDHPMNYTNSAFKEQRPATAEERQAYLYDRRMIEDLISEYNYRVDASLAKTPNYGDLNKLFTDDAEVTFPSRGKYQGNTGLGEWLMSPVSAFHRMSVSEVCLQHVDQGLTLTISICPQTTASSSSPAMWHMGAPRGSRRRDSMQQTLVRDSSQVAIIIGRFARLTRSGRSRSFFST